MEKDCIFCKLAMKENSENFIYENSSFFSIYDIKPELEGHALIISKKHFSNILDLPDSIGADLIDSIKKTTFILEKKFNCEGFNIVNNLNEVAGMIIPHFHIHILPRKKSDNLILKFIDKSTKRVFNFNK
jgi:histidine triad (HIT) family protein